jgi:glutathione S-transferase
MGDSGNCYKVRLVLAQLGIDYERIPTNILEGASRTSEFLKLNPNGRVPLLILPDGEPLAESNAMLYYLARDSALWPQDRLNQAFALQWMFFEQYSHEPFIATNRYWIHILGDSDGFAAQIAERHPKGVAALEVMEQHLGTTAYFVGNQYSVADISLYAYTHVAEQGGYDLRPYAAVREWLTRVASQPGHVPITA